MFKVYITLLFIAKTSFSEDCKDTINNTITFKVYYGWPFTYSCVNVFESVDYEYDLESYGEYTCQITEVESGIILSNTSFIGSLFEGDFEPTDQVGYKFDTINEFTPTKYRADIQNASSCWIEYFTLEPTEFENETCEENIGKSSTHDVEKFVHSTFRGSCDVPGGSETPMELVNHETMNSNTTRIYWLYNCGKELPQNVQMMSGSPILVVPQISYESNPGIYTCVVEHNNMKRYRIHHNICVKEKVSTEITISCVDGRAKIGSDVTITCHIDAGVGKETRISFFGSFDKLNTTGEVDYKDKYSSCVSYANRGMINSTNIRFSCQLNIIDESVEKCFYQLPSEEDLKQQKTSLTMYYIIRNVQESDFGAYRAQINRNDIAAIGTFFLTKNTEENLKRHNYVLMLSILMVSGIPLFAIMLFVFGGVELKWFWFIYCTAEEKDTKKYTVYLAYYFNRDTYYKRSPKLGEFISHLSSQLRGPVFDKCREIGSEQYKAESIFAKLGQCHRVVIVLTPEYINDQWSVYEAFEAWKTVIENGIEILFITFPNTMSAIANLPEEPKIALKKCLKRHKVLHWNGKLPFNHRTQLQLKMFMPKLPRKAEVLELKTTTLDEEDPLLII